MDKYERTATADEKRAWFLELAIEAARVKGQGSSSRDLCIAADVFRTYVETGDDD